KILEAVHRSDFLFDLKSKTKIPLKHLDGKAVAAFCAIGDPQSFEKQLRDIGADVVQSWRYPDHHPYTRQELRSIDNVRKGAPAVTTTKDLPRLPRGWPDILRGEVLALAVSLQITKGEPTWQAELSKRPNGRS